MSLNLITDEWIPVVRHGRRMSVRPHEIACEGVGRLDWPRDDLNLACLELLIGLVYLGDPPRNDGDWHDRYHTADPERLRHWLEPFSPYFELTGEGPRFLQDFEHFEEHASRARFNPPDRLFIDGAGARTVTNNADVMVKRNRYTSLPLGLAAMALYTLQAFAPSGGAGNRASMRGGGPMVTLIKPLDGGTCPLWRLVWCNVPHGQPVRPDRAAQALPWLRPTRTSEKGQIVTPDVSHDAEAFFGMPRRLRLLFDKNVVSGFVQRPYGTRYARWQHPLSPYYCRETGGELLPVHPRPGKVTYQDWSGLAFGRGDGVRIAARTVRRYQELDDAPPAALYAGGWAMSNMKALDFSLHACPTFGLDKRMEMRVGALVEAAGFVSRTLAKCLRDAVAMQGAAADAVLETVYCDSEPEFVGAIRSIASGGDHRVERAWIKTLRFTVLALFDRHAVSSLASRNVPDIEAVVAARRRLLGIFAEQSGVYEILHVLTAGEETGV